MLAIHANAYTFYRRIYSRRQSLFLTFSKYSPFLWWARLVKQLVFYSCLRRCGLWRISPMATSFVSKNCLGCNSFGLIKFILKKHRDGFFLSFSSLFVHIFLCFYFFIFNFRSEKVSLIQGDKIHIGLQVMKCTPSKH